MSEYKKQPEPMAGGYVEEGVVLEKQTTPTHTPRGSLFQRAFDSFKPAVPGTAGSMTVHTADGEDTEKGVPRGPGAGMNPPTYEEAHLKRRLKGRHLQMIAIGGSIGTGLFVGSGSALANGGPAALLIDFSLIGLMLFCTVHALGELAVLFPIPGSFSIYSSRFLDPAWGFSMGWNYAMQWLVVLPLELTAAAITLEFWKGSANVNVAVWITIFLILIIVINLFGVRGYGEAEFVFSAIKVVAVIGFIILGVVLNCGGGPRGGYIGGRYWRDPGAFSNGFKGVCSVFVTAAFSFAGTELVGLAAAETENPRKTLPRAVKQVFWRITLFYIISLLLVGMLVPYTNENLLGASGANASPFVIAITNAGINGLDSVMNVVIMISVLSVGNSSVYGSSRTLAALADNGLAPKIFSYVDREGRPLAGVLVSLILGCLAYINCSASGTVVFNWLVALSGLSNFFTWGSICAAHIMFRRAWKVQGYTVDQIPFRAALGTWGSWLGLIMNILCLIAQFYVALFPIGGSPDAESFFMSYLAFPIIIVTYLGWKIYKRPAFMTPRTIDLVTGRRDMDLDAIRREEELVNMNRSKLKRAYYWCC